jgi:ribosomal protein S18 acetylase RimI-like enzyme
MKMRAATVADVPALMSLLRRSWLATWAPELALETVQRFAALDPAGQYAREKWQEFIVMEDEGALLGMFHIEGNHLHAIHLDPKHKRRGIGSQLMDEVERQIGLNYREAALEVRGFNTDAIAFYKQRGWLKRRAYPDMECGERVETFEMVKTLDKR